MSDKKFQRKLAKIKKKGERYKQEYELREAYAQYVPERKTRKVSNIMLVVVVVGILAYTIANLWITYTTGVSIDSTLTTCFYAFWGSELVALTSIKLGKVLKQRNNTTNESTYDPTCGKVLGDDSTYE